MQTLFETQRLILNDFEQLPYYERHHYGSIKLGNRVNGIVGGRGTGKTTFLLKTALELGAQEGAALYVSADNVFFLDHTLLSLASWAYKETDVATLLIDEIHKYPNWNQELKNIYDTFANLKVIFTGSSMIDIVRSKYDLSRRVTLYPMHGFSFREYLKYYHDIEVPRVSLEDLIENSIQISSKIKVPKILKHFRDYCQLGYYPFTKTLEFETDCFQAIENIAQKTIYEDISTLHNLKTASLQIIERLYKYVLSAPAGELNTNKLASRLEKDFNDVSKYLWILSEAGLIHALTINKAGKAALNTPAKILPDNSNMIYAHFLPMAEDNLRGKVRETIFVNQVVNAGHKVFYSKIGDFQVGDYYFEIGGKNKTQKQLNKHDKGYVVADDIIVGNKRIIPLYLFGLMY